MNLRVKWLLCVVLVMISIFSAVNIGNSHISTRQSVKNHLEITDGSQFIKDAVDSLLSKADGTPLEKALDYLRSIQQPDGCISDFATSSWAVMAIAAAKTPMNGR